MIRKSVIFGTLVLFFSSCLGPFDPITFCLVKRETIRLHTEALVGHWNLNEGEGGRLPTWFLTAFMVRYPIVYG